MARRWRLTLMVLTGLALALVLAAIVSVYLLLQPERFTRMLQTQARTAGLELSLASPASPSLFPRPALQLDGITLNAVGASAPILLAAHGQLALPWHTLLGGSTAISELEIDSPRVDLDALQNWLSSLPPQPEGAPPNIPRIDTGVSISHGSVVRGNQLLLSNVSLQAGSLATGEPFPLSLAAVTAAGTPLQLQLSATPRIEGNALQLQNISLHLAQGESIKLALTGSAYWHGAANASANLAGKLEQANADQYDISVQLIPADQSNPLLLALKLDGPANHADLRLPPLALAHWWSSLDDPATTQLTIPPGSGHAEIASLDVAGIRIEGLTIQAGDDAPATAATAAAPAAKPAPRNKP
ncbi:AsmA family protein [Rhodanobacter sp. AS-Z3]|uniref:AsmA family protein n=1 Tax=Rhodanobacter sp. AS-Z3 TaxID=3031330 RepID=UPI002478BDDC|nr:AsmA family protein [Rhodanobacter sp. AS-Z3]WEN14642.1 AsmA family protein [Rhodanobacter sp. AS-Z3]